MYDLFGNLSAKLNWLNSSDLANFVKSKIEPKKDMWLLQPSDNKISLADESFPKIDEIFKKSSVGILTAQDQLSVQFSENELRNCIVDFIKLDTTKIFRERSLLPRPDDWKIFLSYDPLALALKEKAESRDWQVKAAQNDIIRFKDNLPVKTMLYRPFDVRWTAYTGKSRGFHCMPRSENMSHMQVANPLGLISARSNKTGMADHFFVSELMTEAKTGESGTQSNLFPLWLKPEGTETRTLPNIAPAFASRIAALTHLKYDDGTDAPAQTSLAGILPPKPQQLGLLDTRRERGDGGLKSFGPRDLFDWIYAVLHSPAYRARYADYLKSDFARIPLPKSRTLFQALIPLGTKLVALHLLDAKAAPELENPKNVRLAGSGNAQVTRKFPDTQTTPFEGGKMYINDTQWFETVPARVNDFHIGGYRPARKWLKDRTATGGQKPSPGRILTEEDILHYRRMIVAMDRTIDLMAEIDAVIETHGGWPGAFAGMVDDVDSAKEI